MLFFLPPPLPLFKGYFPLVKGDPDIPYGPEKELCK
jgi:hypothetical protein